MAHRVNAGKLVLAILALLLAGIPVVAFIWETLNHLLSGQVEFQRLLITLPLILLLFILLRVAAAVLRKFEEPEPSTR